MEVGWFIKPGSGDATLVSLSPFALAFVAGYGSDLFFVFLDKIVQAFGGGNSSATTNIREVTTGGITTTMFRHRETHIAGEASGRHVKEGPETTEGGKPTTESRASDPQGEVKKVA